VVRANKLAYCLKIGVGTEIAGELFGYFELGDTEQKLFLLERYPNS
jgi:hypothetical protein